MVVVIVQSGFCQLLVVVIAKGGLCQLLVVVFVQGGFWDNMLILRRITGVGSTAGYAPFVIMLQVKHGAYSTLTRSKLRAKVLLQGGSIYEKLLIAGSASKII